MLTSLEFIDFRGFHQLKLEGLQRVNLIVGKNNSGKTSLLEGIALLFDPNGGNPPFGPHAQIKEFRRLEQSLAQRPLTKWVIRDGAAAGGAVLRGTWDQQELKADFNLVPNNKNTAARKPDPARGTMHQQRDDAIPYCIVPVQHKAPEQLVKSFGQAVRRRGAEELLEACLRTVDPRINKVRVDPVENNVFHVTVDIGLSERVPLSQVGQGIYRLVEIFSEIIGTGAQACFIDEIENGIHHSCQVDVWKGIAEAAEKFDVQVFATTHSHECIEAAHTAFLERDEYDFAVVQLFRKTINVEGRVWDQQHIAAAMDGEIDLRG